MCVAASTPGTYARVVRAPSHGSCTASPGSTWCRATRSRLGGTEGLGLVEVMLGGWRLRKWLIAEGRLRFRVFVRRELLRRHSCRQRCCARLERHASDATTLWRWARSRWHLHGRGHARGCAVSLVAIGSAHSCASLVCATGTRPGRLRIGRTWSNGSACSYLGLRIFAVLESIEFLG